MKVQFLQQVTKDAPTSQVLKQAVMPTPGRPSNCNTGLTETRNEGMNVDFFLIVC